MRIFLVYHPSGNLSVPSSKTWYKNLYEPLIDLGHDVYDLRLDEFAAQHNLHFRSLKFKEFFNNQLVQIFAKEHNKKPFDIFLSYLTSNDIDSITVEEIKRLGVVTLNFSCNNTHQFNLIEGISKSFDYNLHSEKDAADKFNAIGAKPVWFPMAANPKYYNASNFEFNYDVSFIGAAYAKRAYYIHHLIQNNIKVDCFGPNWLINKPYASIKKIRKELVRLKWLVESMFIISLNKRYKISSDLYNYDLLGNIRKLYYPQMHYPCTDDEMINIINHSKINLGFLEVFSESNGVVVKQHLHLREFEIPMCGGLYITNYSDELAEFYEIDKEVLVFRNEHELLDKVKFYLKNENAAQKIRSAAYNRSHSCHTYHIRFKKLFEQLKLK